MGLESNLSRDGFRHLTAFCQRVASLPAGDYVFRGQASAAWRLTPHVFRAGAVGINSIATFDLWRRAAGRFIDPPPVNGFEWLIHAQHHGIPTNLLDWTSNPLTALYFAAAEHLEEPGRAWAMPRRIFHEPREYSALELFSLGAVQPTLIDASPYNRRAGAQDSYMSLHSIGHYEIEGAAIPLYDVAPGNRHAILAALECVGQSPGRLFADINVVAQQFRESEELRWVKAQGDAWRAARAMEEANARRQKRT